MSRVDSGDGAYGVSLPVSHVDHPIPQLPVVSVILPNVVHPRPQEANDFAVYVIVSYKIAGGDVSPSSDARDGAVRHNVPWSVAFPAGSCFDGGRRCGNDVGVNQRRGSGGKGKHGEWGPDYFRVAGTVPPV